MKSFEKIANCVAGCLVWCLAAHAGEPAQAKNPYATIANRNIFHLVSPKPTPPVTPPVDPPPKILPHGLINVFGRAQVIFKMEAPPNSPGAKSGTKPKESSYILAEGEEHDGVRVMHIDMINAIVTFNNHGTVQQIPLTKPPVTTAQTKPPPTPARILFNRFNQFNRFTRHG